MKPELFKRSTTASFSLMALCFATAPALRSQGFPGSGQPGYRPVELVTPQSESFALANLLGKPVRGANQEEFTTLSDFLIEPRSGRVHFAVVHSGSNTHRIIPMRALQAGSGTAGLVVSLDRAKWDRVGTMTEAQLQGRVVVDAAHQQRLQQQFILPDFEAPVDGLVRASTLKGRELRTGNDQLGTVEDVVIDFHNKIAAPMVKTAARFGSGEQKVLVHFTHLQLNDNGQGPITANLSRDDFGGVRSQLTPTGVGGGYYNQAAQPLNAAAVAVQQALEGDASIPRGSVHAVPEPRIVLRGSVPSDQKRAEMERAAQQAAPGVRIENQLMVRP